MAQQIVVPMVRLEGEYTIQEQIDSIATEM
jgi:hypothetical protein